MIQGPDLSGHQPGVNFAAVKASGRDFAVLKATEGIGWTDPTFAAYRDAAHAAGLIVGAYHFARADSGNSPAAEARSFLNAVGPLRAGEFLVLDWEVPYGGDHVAWCTAWLDAVAARTGVNPLIYMNQSACAGHNWTPVAATYGLWLAKYDGSTAQPSVPYWGGPAMKQFTDAATVPGVGACDLNVFYGSAAQLLAYGLHGAAPTPPAPIVLEDDMRLIRDPNSTVWGWTDCDLFPIGSDAAGAAFSGAAQRVWGPLVDVTAAELAAIQAYTAAAKGRRDQLIGDVHGKLTTAYDLGGRPTDGADDLYGHVLNTEARVVALAATVAALPTTAAPMPCQGNPKAVLGALGQAATAAASTTP